MYKEKNNMPFCGLEGRLYPTGVKAPKFEFKRRLSDLKLTCTLTKKKYRFSEYLKWWQSEQVQRYVKLGYECRLETKTQEPYQQAKYGEYIEQVICFVMRKPYTPRPNIGGFKSVGESIPVAAQGQNFAPDNAKPITQEDLSKIDRPIEREPGEVELDDTIPF